MKVIKAICFLGLAGFVLQSCTKAGGNNPGNEFAPDMYVSKGYEPMSQLADQVRSIKTASGETVLINKDGKNMREPVKGTVARGQMGYLYPYPNTPEGYEKAIAELKSPLTDTSAAVLAEGKYMYDINCAVCHGEKGLADGTIVAAGKFPPPPSYKSDRIKQLAEGGMYHTITYGKNLMGSYASVLSPTDRWKVIKYVQSLRDAQ